MGLVRFIHAERGRVGTLVSARVAFLTQSRSVLVVSARIPSTALRPDLGQAGADLSRVFVLDVTTHHINARPSDPNHEAFLAGPAMLELITTRAKQIIRAKAERAVTVVIDDVATFAHYNRPEALSEILRHAMMVRQDTTDLEYVWSGLEPPALLDAGSKLVHDQADILPSGELARRPTHSPASGRKEAASREPGAAGEVDAEPQA